MNKGSKAKLRNSAKREEFNYLSKRIDVLTYSLWTFNELHGVSLLVLKWRLEDTHFSLLLYVARGVTITGATIWGSGWGRWLILEERLLCNWKVTIRDSLYHFSSLRGKMNSIYVSNNVRVLTGYVNWCFSTEEYDWRNPVWTSRQNHARLIELIFGLNDRIYSQV